MSDVQCPLPSPISSDEARSMYGKVKKEMPGLTQAAWRREAARRMGTDYDTFLKAWKKPKIDAVPDPVPPPVGGTPRAPAGKITKKTIPEDKLGTSYSSSLRPAGKTSVEVRRDGEVIGYVQKVVEGSYERTSTGIRTHFVIDRRGWVAMDKNGRVLKDGFSAFKYGQDEAIDLVKVRAGAVEKIPDPPKAPGSPKPPTPDGPKVLTRDEARRVEKQVAKELGLKPGTAASRKAAADRLGMRYDDYLAAWKGEIPKVPVGDPLPPSYDTSGSKATTPQPNSPVKFTENDIADFIKRGGFKRRTSIDTGFEINKFADEVRVTWVGPLPDPTLRKEFLKDIAKLFDGTPYKTSISDFGIPSLKITQGDMVWGPSGPVRTVLDSTKAAQIAEKKMGAKFKGRFPDASRAVNDELTNQISYVGSDLADGFNGVVRAAEDPHDSKYEIDNPNVLAYFRGGLDRKVFVPDRVSTNPGYGARHYRQQKAGWFSKCDHSTSGVADNYHGLQNIFAHEFGHFVDNQASLQTVPMYNLFSEISKDLGLDAAEASELRLSNSMHMNSQDIRSVSLRTKISKEVSRYAATNRAEFFAEVWAEYTRAGVHARPLIQKWGSMIQDIIERAAE